MKTKIVSVCGKCGAEFHASYARGYNPNDIDAPYWCVCGHGGFIFYRVEMRDGGWDDRKIVGASGKPSVKLPLLSEEEMKEAIQIYIKKGDERRKSLPTPPETP